MSRFAQQSDVPPIRLIELGAEKSEESLVPVKPAVVGNLRLQRIEQFLTLKNLATNTRRNYERHLQQFELWVNKDWHQITMNDLKRYKTYLESGRQLKQGSVGAVLTALKSFFSWLKKAGYIEENPGVAISIPVTPETEGKNLELFQVEALFKALDGRKTQRRDRVILCLMVYAGMRAEEISHLNAGDYNGVEVIIRKAKHGSVGRVPVDEQTHAALQANLQLRLLDCEGKITEDDPMFASYSPRNWGQRLGYEGIYKMVKALAKEAGWPDIHPHKGRHTYASQLIEDGMDAYLAMTLMRQRSVKAFEVYSQRVRYRTAKAVFLEGKKEVERKAMSLEELVRFEERAEKSIQLEAVVEESSNWPQNQAVDMPLNEIDVVRVYQLKITLLGVRPQVWRRIQVQETMTLTQLHSVLQAVMGWEGYHLHEFPISEDESLTLAALLGDELFSFSYLYDFGDMWQHEIEVEKRLASEPGKDYPVCLAGKRACPPEDCGGDWGYAHLLKVLKNRRHPEYRERKEWVGRGFDPKVFDIEEVNQALRELELQSAGATR